MDVLEGLNEPQKQAVTHVEGPLLVLAGAGSGKTRVITRRLAYLAQQGIPAGQLLAITFTNKAAEEMKHRTEALGVPRAATVCTFHSLAARLLREYAAEAGLSGAFSILDRDDQVRVMKEAVANLSLPADKFAPAAVHAVVSRAKNQLQTPPEFAQTARDERGTRLAALYREYERLLAAASALDFDDLLLRLVMLMREKPEVRLRLADRFRYVQIDEYQDTNRAQYFIAHGIALEHQNLCATGDPDQSIYGWRGADIRNILDFQKDYPQAKVVRLEENYRSAAPILQAASRLIAHNTQRKDKSLWTRRPGGADVHVLTCDDEHAEARELARRAAAYHCQGRQYSDMAVFYRTNSLSRVLEEGLRRAGIPYRIARGVEFYNRKEIKDALAYLKLMVNPADNVGLLRAINTPPRGIGKTTVDKLADFAHRSNIPLLEACRTATREVLGAAAARLAAFAQFVASLSSGLPGTVADTVERVIQASGLAEAAPEGAEGDRPRANLAELVSAAAEFDELSEGGTLADYLIQVSLVSDVDHFEGAGGAVTLMTLHAAKGLEFPVVFIVGCEQGLLPFEREPTEWSTHDDSRQEEERRLAFVGMTRAKDELVLSCARRRMVRGHTLPQAPSPFLYEIGRDSVSAEDLTTAPPEPPRPARRYGGGFYADVADRSAIESQADRAVARAESEAHPECPPEYEYLRVGSKVRHAAFGLGKVLRLHQPWPDTRAEIDFQRWGKKTLVLSRTKLELADS